MTAAEQAYDVLAMKLSVLTSEQPETFLRKSVGALSGMRRSREQRHILKSTGFRSSHVLAFASLAKVGGPLQGLNPILALLGLNIWGRLLREERKLSYLCFRLETKESYKDPDLRSTQGPNILKMMGRIRGLAPCSSILFPLSNSKQ